MIQFERFDFAAPPFTCGGQFVMTMLHAGLKLVGRKDDLVSVPFSADSGRLRVSLVRHPYNWLHEYHKMLVSMLDTQTNASFNEFVLDYVQKTPGRVSWMFTGYVADTCLRVEDFPMAMAEFVESLGTPCAISGGHEPLNFAGQNDELRRRVVSAEKEFCLQYDYWG
jgi:hypothetical protein